MNAGQYVRSVFFQCSVIMTAAFCFWDVHPLGLFVAELKLFTEVLLQNPILSDVEGSPFSQLKFE